MSTPPSKDPMVVEVVCSMCGGSLVVVRETAEETVVVCEACGHARAVTEAPPASRRLPT